MKRQKEISNLGKVAIGGTVVTTLFLGAVTSESINVLNDEFIVNAYEFDRKEDVVTLQKDSNGEIRILEEVKYLVIHETANEGKGADAEAHYNLVNREHDSYVYSYAFVVDDTKAIQMAPIDAKTVHTKSGNGITNNNAIGIEMCVNEGSSYEDTIKNTIKLVRDVILPEYPNIKIVQHYDAYGKDCPSKLRKSGRWNDFIDAIYDERETDVVLGWKEETVVNTKSLVKSTKEVDTSKMTRKERKLKEKEDKVSEIELLLQSKEQAFEKAKQDLSVQKENKVEEINNLEQEEISKIEEDFNQKIKELEEQMKNEITKKTSEFDKKEEKELKVIEDNFSKDDAKYEKEIDNLQDKLKKAEEEYQKQLQKNKTIIERITESINSKKEENILKTKVKSDNEQTENKEEKQKETIVEIIEDENLELQKQFQKSIGVIPEVIETKTFIDNIESEQKQELKKETKQEVKKEETKKQEKKENKKQEKESEGLFSFLFKSKELYNAENVLEKSNIKEKDLEKALKNLGCKQLVGYAGTFIDMEKEYGINAVILSSMAIHDTKKGGDLYSTEEKIEEMANKIVNKYINLDKDAEWLYIGSSKLKDIGGKYSPNNQNWSNDVLEYAKQIKK